MAGWSRFVTLLTPNHMNPKGPLYVEEHETFSIKPIFRDFSHRVHRPASC